MEKIGLENGVWKLREVGDSHWIPTTVPGEVHVALLQAGRIPDPFESDYELLVKWVAEKDWEFQGLIDIPEDFLTHEQAWLVFDGLDTLTEISLNGEILGKTENAFRTYKWEIRKNLHPGENIIHILFKSPVKYVERLQEERPMAGVEQAIPGGPYLRKAPCQWGWDWGPQLPPIGIWKGARIEGYSNGKFGSIHIRQTKKYDGCFEVTAKANIDYWGDMPMQICMRLKDPNDNIFATTCKVIDQQATAIVSIPDPMLWWPNGYGSQPLYEAVVTLRTIEDNQIRDRKTFQIGLRTLELRQDEDEFGKSFTFVVNNVPIFAKGSNWIPADSFPTRITHDVLDRLLSDAVLAHHNMIRVWGGGFYEDENFYDLCDQYGILVWQDFSFSCSIYPLDDPEYVENIHQEVVDNVERIRHRACLGLWCGNNEMDQGWEDWGWNTPEYAALREAYRLFFYETLPRWVQEHDPDTSYWFSSPTSATPFENANSNNQGDAHYWDVWHGAQPFSAYREQYPRFMSEFGFQSLPPLKTIKFYADETHWNLTDYMIEHHQRNAFASALFMGQMAQHYMMPADFPSLVYLTMVLQADGIRYGVEHWRRAMHRVSGTLYWQLNDCWPVASWSSIDYFGRWKALHYFCRRFYAPLLLSIEDDEQQPKMGVYLTSDLQTQWSGEVRWRLMRLNGEVVDRGEMDVTVNPLSSIKVFEKKFSSLSLSEKRENVFVAELIKDGEVISKQVASFVRTKHVGLVDPQLKARVRLDENENIATIELEAQYLARFVELSFDDADVVFSDNYFDVLPGEQVQIQCPVPDGWTVDDIGKSLTVFSLYDSFA